MYKIQVIYIRLKYIANKHSINNTYVNVQLKRRKSSKNKYRLWVNTALYTIYKITRVSKNALSIVKDTKFQLCP